MPGSYQLDLDNQCLLRDRERVPLPPKAFLVLRHLALSPGRLVTKNELLEAAWPDTFVGDAVLTVTVKQLRDLLGDDARRPRYIETVHRRGFRLIGELPCERRSIEPVASSESLPLATPPREGHAPFGRDSALRELLQAWGEALQGHRRVAFVSGEPGIGKTTLVDAFLEEVSDERGPMPINGPSVLLGRGRCLEDYGSTEAYLPVLEALEDVLRAPGSDAFSKTLQRCAPTWLVQLPWLLAEGDIDRLRLELQWSTRERMLRELSTALEMASADTPILLVLEDLHWSDPSTVSLLSFLGQRRQPARLFLLCTYRPVELIVANHPLREVRQRLQATSHCLDVPLSYLMEADVRAFLEERLAGDVDASVVRRLHAGSNGNPLFLSRLLDHWLAGGEVRRDGDRWIATPIDPVPERLIPAGLREVIEQGFARLGDEEMAVLEAASACGREFSTAAAASCLDRETTEIERVCESLARRGDAVQSSGTSILNDGRLSGRYRFVHALVQNVFYQRLAPSLRARFHQRLGSWGESNSASAAELAHHFSLAGSSQAALKAIAYAQQAAARAHTLFAYEEAASHWRTALRVRRQHPNLEGPPEGELVLSLAKALQRGGQFLNAEATFQEAVRLARTSADGALLARAAIGIGHGYQRIGQPDEALVDLLEEAVRGLGDRDLPLRALVLAHLDYALSSVPGSLARRAGLSDEALETSRRSEDLETRVWVLQYVRWACRGPQEAGDWRAGVGEIRSLLEKAADTEQMLTLRYLLITDLLELGEMAEARTELNKLVELCEAAQLPWFLWMVARLRTALALLWGDLDAVEELAAETCRVGQISDHPNVMQMYAAQLTLLRLEQGRLDEIESVVRAAVAQNPYVTTWRVFLAYLLRELGEPKEARELFESVAEKGFADVPRDTTWFIFAAFASSLIFDLGDRARAELLYAELLPYQDRCTGLGSTLLSFGHVRRYLGLLAAAAGRGAEAMEHFEIALRENRRMGAWPWVALTAYDYARARLAAAEAPRDRASALLEEAIGIGERIGMPGWVERFRSTAQRTASNASKPRPARRTSTA